MIEIGNKKTSKWEKHNKEGNEVMQMKKKIKSEKASMAVYVAVVLTGILFILVAIHTTTVSVRKSQLQTNLKIKESYELDNTRIDEIYNKLYSKLP